MSQTCGTCGRVFSNSGDCPDKLHGMDNQQFIISQFRVVLNDIADRCTPDDAAAIRRILHAHALNYFELEALARRHFENARTSMDGLHHWRLVVSAIARDLGFAIHDKAY